MKKLISSILFFLFSLQTFGITENDSILKQMFYTLENKKVFDAEKELKINTIRKQFQAPDISDNQRYKINDDLQSEFQSYKIDSAVFYLEKNLAVAKKLNNLEYIYRTKLTLTFMYWQMGKFFESLQLPESINREEVASISNELLRDYFEAYKRIYIYYANFQNDAYNMYYEKSHRYRDSLMPVIPVESKKYMVLTAEILTEQCQTQKAAEILEKLVKKSVADSHDKAILANIYAQDSDKIEQQIKYYAISAICDIKNAVKENTSMLALSLLLYQKGDIDNAYRCLQSAMEDAAFCNARFRTYEISKIFPVIDSAYKAKTLKQKKELKIYLLLVSVLSLFLILAIIVIYRHLVRIAKIRKELYHANLKLQKLNADLQNSNWQLAEINLVKDTYLAKFIDLCSNYIEKIDNYRRSLNKIAREGKTEKLLNELKSDKFINNELQAFYTNFDETFLRLYPSFIDDFNNLFPETERQTLKQSEILNTELRIYALIRLGINDSSKIALFLRCSITTIYTYRSKLKHKSLFRNSLEEQIMKIGK
jgi:hypothetical protein